MASGTVTVTMEASPLQEADDPAGPWSLVREDGLTRRFVGVFVTALLPGESLNPAQPPDPNYIIDTTWEFQPWFTADWPRRRALLVPPASDEPKSWQWPDATLTLVVVGLGLLSVGLGLFSVPLSLSVLGGLLLIAGLWSHHSNVASSPTVSEGHDNALAGHVGD